MSEKPILFSGEMVREILTGGKNQTRRVVKFPKWYEGLTADDYESIGFWNCNQTSSVGEPKGNHWQYGDDWVHPNYQVGDTLWVRETWATPGNYDHVRPSELIGHMFGGREMLAYRASENYPVYYNWRPSIFMPRWASRITLQVASVRVERLQDITLGDAIMEGCPKELLTGDDYLAPLDWFQGLWDKINAKRGYGWDVNPWVWVIEFGLSTPRQ